MNTNPAEQMMDKLIKLGWIDRIVSVDLENKNSNTSMSWTPEGKIFLKYLMAYKSLGPLSPGELSVLLDFASQVHPDQGSNPPRS